MLLCYCFAILLIAILYFLYWLLRYVIVDALFMREIRGKTILVVGCSSGFGHDFALKCAKNGAIVFAGCYPDSQAIDLLMKECDGESERIFPFILDVTNQESVDNAYTFVLSHLTTCFGAEKGLDALVNNAGIVACGADDWLSTDVYERLWQVNALGLIRVTQKFKKLVKMSKGRIVNVSSCCGRIAFAFTGPYTVSKYAVEAYSDTIRRELEPYQVKVSIIEPSYFKTALTASIPSSFRNAFYSAPKEVQEEYGEEYFETVLRNQEELINSSRNSPHREWVVDCYYHAIVSPFPKKRYVVGNDANYIFMPIARMTADLQDVILRFVARMDGIPRPKVLLQQQQHNSVEAKIK